MDLDVARRLHRPAESKILLLVMDGLGGLSHPKTGKTELETAYTPNLDALAARSDLGQTLPVGYGVTPGSGPGHLALFGYDPMEVQIGRGVLEAVGIDFDLDPSDVAARGNFCTLDSEGRITDRRARRIPTAQMAELVKRLNTIARSGDIETLVAPVQEHRFVLVLRGAGLSEAVTETDPQQVGVQPLACKPLETDARRTAGRRQRIRGAGAGHASGRGGGQRADAARLCQDPVVPVAARRVGTAGRELRHLSYVSRARHAGRDARVKCGIDFR